MATKKTSAKEEKQKQKVINRINKLIRINGSFTTDDAEAKFPPVIEAINKDHQILAEIFHENYCEANEYEHGEVTDFHTFDYEDLDFDILEDILTLVEDWDAICYKTEKRCSN